MNELKIYWLDGADVMSRVYKMEHFPSYADMFLICKANDIRADDFMHTYIRKDRLFYVGKFFAGSLTKGHKRGVRFIIRCDKAPTYEELAR